MSKARLLPFLVLAWMVVAARPIAAHPLPLEVVVYLEAGSSAVRAVLRIPSAFLADARLPRREDGYLDLARIEGPMSGVVSYAARTLDLMIDGRSLPPPSSSWTLSRQLDPGFDDFRSASAQAAAPRPAPDARINPDTMVVNLALNYALPSGVDPAGRLSLRVNDFRVSDQSVQMRVVDVSQDGSTRSIVTRGTPRRLDLDPGRLDVLAMFARRGLDRLRLSSEIVLFLLCLAIPRRTLDDTMTNFSVFAAGCLVALLGASAAGPAGAALAPVFRAGSAALLIVAALQNIAVPRATWTRAAALAFGVFEGASLGVMYASDAPLAGGHLVTGLVAYAAPLVAGALLILLVARPLVDLAYRTRLQERWAVLLLSALPIHAGLHGMLGILPS